MSQISQLSKLTIAVTVCVTAGVPHTTSLVPQQPNLLLADTFMAKGRFYHFFPAPNTKRMWRQRLRKSVVDIIYPKSSLGSASASGVSGDGPCGGGLAASYTQKSTDSDSALLSSRIRISSDRNRLGPDSFSLINPQFITVSLDAQNGTELPAKSRSSSRRCRYKSTCFLSYVMQVSSAVIGSGAHVAMVCSDWLWCACDYGSYGWQC